MAKKTDLKEKNVSELNDLLSEKREELRGLRFGSVGARLKDNAAPRKTRSEIARIMTELGSRERAAKNA